MICAACKADLAKVERVGRRDACPRCGADLRSCRNCSFHDPRVSHECREPQAEPVLDKMRSNFCDYFAVRAPSVPNQTGHSPEPADDARRALERLFHRR